MSYSKRDEVSKFEAPGKKNIPINATIMAFKSLQDSRMSSRLRVQLIDE